MPRDRRQWRPPALSSRCEATAANTACTSSGTTRSRPASNAQARAARTRPWPARGDRPIWMSLRARVLAISACTYSSNAGDTCTRCTAACSSRTPLGIQRRRHAGQQVAAVATAASSARSCAASGYPSETRIRKRSSCDSGSAERAQLLVGILRGHHEERIRQAVGGDVDADLAFFHGLEQRALRRGLARLTSSASSSCVNIGPLLELELLPLARRTPTRR